MSMAKTNVNPDERIQEVIRKHRAWRVRAWNNDTTSFADVLQTLMSVCGYTAEVAEHYTLLIHKGTHAIVYWNDKRACQILVDAFARIGVKADLLENNRI